MATTKQLISVEEFLSSPRYERFEYDAGVVTEKPMPNWKHGRLCAWIIALILKFYPEYAAGPEVRSRLRHDKWKLPDVLVALLEQIEGEEYATRPPHLCIEVLSHDDTREEMFEKCRQYHDWGASYCWILDPEKEVAWQSMPDHEPVLANEVLSADPISFRTDVLFSCLHKGFRPTLLNS